MRCMMKKENPATKKLEKIEPYTKTKLTKCLRSIMSHLRIREDTIMSFVANMGKATTSGQAFPTSNISRFM